MKTVKVIKTIFLCYCLY